MRIKCPGKAENKQQTNWEMGTSWLIVQDVTHCVMIHVHVVPPII